MSYQQCIDEISRAAGRTLSDDELDDLLTELERRIEQRRRARTGDALDEVVADAANEYANDIAAAAVIERRNTIISLNRRLQALDFVRTQFPKDYITGVQALLVGTQYAKAGARNSIGAEQDMLVAKYVAGLKTDLEMHGTNHIRAFTKGTMDREVARALWAIGRDQGIPTSVPRIAREIAETIEKWQTEALNEANKAGAWIKKREGYIVKQSHDSYRISAAGYEAWRDAILPRLNHAETFAGADPEDYLKNVYVGLSEGVHLKVSEGAETGFKGPANLARRLSAPRELHFNSADDWFEYNKQFGMNNLRDAVLRGLELRAQATGLMRVLGPNPEDNFNRITKELLRDLRANGRPGELQKFNSAVDGKLNQQLMVVNGTTRMPVNHMGASVGSALRGLQRMAKLGFALFSQFGDNPLFGSEMRYQGDNMLSSTAKSVGAVFRGRGSREKREIGGLLMVVSELMPGEVISRFSLGEDGPPGKMTWAQQLYFTLNGMNWWTDAQRRTAIYTMAHRAAQLKGRAWQGLQPEYQRVLSLYGIGEPEWNIIRQSVDRLADGRNYLVPEGIENLPDDVFTPLLMGRRATPTRMADLKKEVADKYRKYLIDRASFATIMPGPRTRQLMYRDTQPGTIFGEGARFVGELKAFPISVIEKVIGREMLGRGIEPDMMAKIKLGPFTSRGAKVLWDAMSRGNGEMIGLANVILWGGVFGYLAMTIKDTLKGRTPRDPSNYKTWLAALAQGGGLGIYGDFLFGEVRNRYGGGVLTTLAGPTLGNVQNLADLWGRVREGDDAAASAFRLLYSNMPNVFYTKMALDYLILWQAQEYLNPGSLARREATIERENAQTHWLRPSEMVR